MAYIAARGDTLLIPSGPANDPDRKHLFVILTPACADKQHLLIPISSIKEKVFHDPACVIAAGEHPFIKVPSYAAYKLAQTLRADLLQKCVDGWLYLQKEAADERFLTKLSVGLPKSEFVAQRIETYFKANMKQPEKKTS